MDDTKKLLGQRDTAEMFVNDNLVALCKEMVALDDTGLFGNGKLAELRQQCAFAGSSAQSLALGMVQTAAVRAVALQ